MNTDGWIIIGAKLDSKQLEKDLKNDQKLLEKYEKDTEKLTKQKMEIKAKIKIDEEEYKRKIKELNKRQYAEYQAKTINGKISQSVSQKIDAKYDAIREKMDIAHEKRLDTQNLKLREINRKIKSNAVQQDLVTKNVAKTNDKLKTAKTYDAVHNSITKIKNGLTGVLKKVAKWSLAIIGIRSVYLGIRSAMSTLSNEDDGLKSQIDYMKWALANAIKPLIEWIIKALYTIMGIIGKIVMAFTGKNIFENSGIADYEKALKNSNKSAKELKKTIAGFDEMNVLSDNKEQGISLPSASFDLSDTKNWANGVTKIVDDLTKKWFDFGKEMRDALSNPEAFDKAYGEWSLFMQGIVQYALGFWDLITGIVEMLGGLLDMMVGLFTGNWDLVSEGWNYFLNGLWSTLKGILEMMWATIEMVSGLILGIVVELFKGIVGFCVWLFDSIVWLLKSAWDGTIAILSTIGGWIYNYVIKPVGDFFVGMWDGFKNGAKSAWEGVKSVFGSVANFFKDVFTKAWESVKAVFSTGGKIFSGIKDGILEAFKRIVNVIIDGINKVVAIPFNGINKAFDGLRSVDLWGWKPFDWVPRFNVPQIPRLAKGGILNNPGKGVYTGGAIAGEAGREFYMPLQDEQMLSLVGEAIGKHINLSANIPVYVGNRQIAREIRKINNEELFASNG